MGDIAYTAKNIRPLAGASKLPPVMAGGAVEKGNCVYMASDGDVVATDANAAVTVEGIGLVVEVPSIAGTSNTAAADQDAVTVVNKGPVAGFSGMTPGTILYVSATTGKITDVAPTGAGTTWVKVLGWAFSASVVWVDPQVAAATAN